MSEAFVDPLTDTLISDIIEADGLIFDEKVEAIYSCNKILNLEPLHVSYIVPVNFYRQVLPGSHIAYKTETKVLGENIWHHAIYDEDEKIIHMVESGEGICITSVEKFMKDAKQQCVIVEYENDNDDMRKSTRIVANYLLKSLGSTALYQIVNFNCEHFATICRTGKWRYSTNDVINQMCYCIHFPISSSSKINIGRLKLKK